jgi:hypothetical protein
MFLIIFLLAFIIFLYYTTLDLVRDDLLYIGGRVIVS